jgi:hypothetical protein
LLSDAQTDFLTIKDGGQFVALQVGNGEGYLCCDLHKLATGSSSPFRKFTKKELNTSSLFNDSDTIFSDVSRANKMFSTLQGHASKNGFFLISHQLDAIKSCLLCSAPMVEWLNGRDFDPDVAALLCLLARMCATDGPWQQITQSIMEALPEFEKVPRELLLEYFVDTGSTLVLFPYLAVPEHLLEYIDQSQSIPLSTANGNTKTFGLLTKDYPIPGVLTNGQPDVLMVKNVQVSKPGNHHPPLMPLGAWCIQEQYKVNGRLPIMVLDANPGGMGLYYETPDGRKFALNGNQITGAVTFRQPSTSASSVDTAPTTAKSAQSVGILRKGKKRVGFSN